MSAPASSLRELAMEQAQGAMALQLAFIGVANGLFRALADVPRSPEDLAAATGMDPDYVRRWVDAAYAFGYLEESGPGLALTERGQGFATEDPASPLPFAIHTMLGAHMSERTAHFMRTGERPGEEVLGERETIADLFGTMLEGMFGPFFEGQILPDLPVYREIDREAGLAVDLGCGNGWYLRRLAHQYPHLRGVGLDLFDAAIAEARSQAEAEGTADRLDFRKGDMHWFTVDEPIDLIAMNRALHHVWDEKDRVFAFLRDHLKPGGAAVIWEPNWPGDRPALADPKRRGMAFQNLMEHVQGNRFLQAEEIAAEFEKVGMAPDIHLYGEGNEAVVVGRKA
ncbi:methyltransferase type 11 [Thiohalorhabdus denitrificans]|uniref:Methyltransferase domain-containing protein n=1 Tax=Thiohalorhabdus denitrificans TaxID=381306 RepID=A0A0P9GJM1_9GAMM|nr:class I SAM-dependent methyltransferase [Thiohalorhabdus denitrificans]KPV40314.1 methyltransferase type 11 [Thiohalorhabdus denitrificans]SCX80299.1 Methyltransferase domain-containing protein [Thiohalorhabdus denitrificans]